MCKKKFVKITPHLSTIRSAMIATRFLAAHITKIKIITNMRDTCTATYDLCMQSC